MPSLAPRGARVSSWLLGDSGIAVLTAIVTAVSLLLLPALAGLPAPDAALLLPWWILAPLFAVAEAHVIHLKVRHDWHSVSLSEVVLVVGLFLATPSQLVLAQVLGAAVALVAIRRQPSLKAAFNLAQFALGTILAVVVFDAIAGGAGVASVRAWIGAVAAIAVGGAVGLVLVVAAMSMDRRELALGGLRFMLAFGLVASLAATSLSLLVLTVVDVRPAALALALAPAALFLRAYQASAKDRQRQEGIDALHRAVRELQESGDGSSRVGALLEEARTIFRAEMAEILFLTDGGATCHRLRRDADGQAEAEHTELLPAEHACLAELATRRSLLLTGRARRTGGGGLLVARDLRDAMVVGLREDERLVGILLVANRDSDAGTFADDDASLLETLASQVHLSLQNARLGRALREQTALRAELDHEVAHDGLTHLPNRAMLLRRLGASLADGAAAGRRPAVLFLDLDDFKTVNDGLGHAAGDAVLIAVAGRLSGCLRGDDMVARLGGDEFVVVLDRVADVTDAARAAARIREALDEPILIAGDEVRIGASIGIRIADGADVDPADLVRDADVAMYRAKDDDGKGSVRFWESSMQAAVLERHRIKADLQGAVERGEMTAHYQPLVDLATRRIVGVESLVRWNHPERGLLGAGVFIELAEESTVIDGIGSVMLAEACHQVRRWQREIDGCRDLRVTVNLSTRQLRDPGFVDEVRRVLAASGLAARHLVLELTESVALKDFSTTVIRLLELHDLGVGIAVDDFGTGYSSLSYLQRLPLDMLKIAKPFVDDLAAGPAGRAFAATVVKLGQALDLEIVGEGIEDESQAGSLARLGCHLGQGFLFSRPLPAGELEALLRAPGAGELPLAA